jgi:hypothetical protein
MAQKPGEAPREEHVRRYAPLQRDRKRALKRAQTIKEEQDQIMLAMIESGASVRGIAAVTGLSVGSVQLSVGRAREDESLRSADQSSIRSKLSP